MSNPRQQRVAAGFVLAAMALSLAGGCAGPDVARESGTATVAPQPTVVTNYVDPVTLADEATAYPYIEMLTEALINVRKFYVTEKTYKEITLGAIHGMLESLDEHSSFLESEEYEAMQDDTAGKFSGIGVTLGVQDGVLTVIAPIEDTPAFRAGMQAGDRIVKIGGEKTTGLTLRDAVHLLRGDKGTSVTIDVQAVDESEPRTLVIVRDDIVVPSVKGASIVRDGVGYVRLTQFAKPSADELQEAITNLLSEGMDALVLDLRNNPGGLLTSAVEVAQKFLPRGAEIVTTRGRAGVSDAIVTRAAGDVRLLDFPMVVLVNGGSASAAEIVAGALKDQHRAVLLGDQTFGKASVQSVVPLRSDESMAVRLTIAYYYTPSGLEIHKKGITPNIEMPISVDEWRRVVTRRMHAENPGSYTPEAVKEHEDVVDRQLERAVDLLQAIKIFK